MARIGIFGGSFNPPHNGHVIMAVECLEQVGLDRLHAIPVAVPPHKAAPDLLPGADRLELLRLAFEGIPAIVVDDREVRRAGPSYSVVTAQELSNEHPQDDLFFLIGGDSVRALPQWRDIERLASLVTFAWYPRAPGDDDGAQAACSAIPGLRLRILTGRRVGISSTELRSRARRDLLLRGFVPDTVEATIRAARHYR